MSEKREDGELFEKMERHIAALELTIKTVTEWDEKRAGEQVSPIIYAGALAAASKKDEAARLSIVTHRPADQTESDLKLQYLAAYVLTTRTPLNPKEMTMIEALTDSSIWRQSDN